MLRRVALVRIDVSEEPSASFIRVTRIGELGTTQAATSNRRKLRRNTGILYAVRLVSTGKVHRSTEVPYIYVNEEVERKLSVLPRRVLL
jgi:hypothetical protein